MAAKPADMLTALRKTNYLGSHPAVARQVEKIDVVFTTEGVSFVAKRTQLGMIRWDAVFAIEADTRDDVERRVTGARVLAMGVLALLAKKETHISYLIVTDDRGEWIFAVPGINAIELRSGLRHLQKYIPDLPAPTSSAPPTAAELSQTIDPADRLTRLRSLLAQGLISEDEHNHRRKAIIDAL